MPTAPASPTPTAPPPPAASPVSRADDGSLPPDHLRFVPWPDAVIEQLGHDPRSGYVERFWLSVLGPSATWLARRVAARLDGAPDGFTVHLGDLAREIGLGTKGGRHSPILHTVDRLAGFGIAQRVEPGTLAVRRRMPPLTRSQVSRLPEALRAEHERWQQAEVAKPTRTTPVVPEPAEVRRRAHRLALSLVELGEDMAGMERQLHRWRFHPAVAYEAASWAWARHHHPAGSGGETTATGNPPAA